jgi:hypothetical protein
MDHKGYPQGYPLHLAENGISEPVSLADALAEARAEVDRLRERVALLEAVARLNADTIRAMQEAAREQELSFHRRRPRLLLPAKGA